jgi:hypothetical protein
MSMNMKDLDQLALLDPVRGREPTDAEWTRARAHVDRVVAGSYDRSSAPVRPAWRSRFALVGAAAAVVAAGVVAVPALLPSTAETAIASWTPMPGELSGDQVLPQARACAKNWATGAVEAADVLLADRRGEATALIVKLGPGLVECMLVGTDVWAMQRLTDGPVEPLANGKVLIDTMSSVGSGDEQYSHVVGRVGESITGIDVLLANGRTIQTSTKSGWWTAWWPGPEGGTVELKVVVHTASGSTTHDPGDLFR